MAGQKDYKTNRYQLSPENRAEIGRRWKKYLVQYGYLATEPANNTSGKTSSLGAAGCSSVKV